MGNCIQKPEVRDHEKKELIVKEDEWKHCSSKILPLASGKLQSSSSNSELFATSVRHSLDIRSIGYPSEIRAFTLHELRDATNGFSLTHLLGKGGFGCVYYGWLEEFGPVGPTGQLMPAAVKKMNDNGVQGHKEWLAEVNYLARLHHFHLVKLIGHCSEDNHHLLIYEFMTNGSLDRHLFTRNFLPLPWDTRVKIALGVAKGMAYLHAQNPPIIYRDLKAANILLNSDFHAKISDFGLARDGPQGSRSHVSTRVVGSYGYADPDYVRTGHLKLSSDVYGFGVLLLEILTGLPALDLTRPRGQRELVGWIKPLLAVKHKRLEILDHRIKGQYSKRAALAVILLATQCLRSDPGLRPTMDIIVEVLCRLIDLMESQEAHGRCSSNKSNAGHSSSEDLSSSGDGSPFSDH